MPDEDEIHNSTTGISQTKLRNLFVESNKQWIDRL